MWLIIWGFKGGFWSRDALEKLMTNFASTFINHLGKGFRSAVSLSSQVESRKVELRWRVVASEDLTDEVHMSKWQNERYCLPWKRVEAWAKMDFCGKLNWEGLATMCLTEKTRETDRNFFSLLSRAKGLKKQFQFLNDSLMALFAVWMNSNTEKRE